MRSFPLSLLALMTLIFLPGLGFGQAPPNDLCANAISFGALPLGISTCQAGTNVGANPEFPYPTTGSCTPSGATTTLGSDVWYSFTHTGNTLTIDLTGTIDTPNVAVYTGTCGSLTGIECVVSTTGGITSVTVLPVAPVTSTYYVQVSGNSVSDTGTFDLCLTSIEDPDLCTQITYMTVSDPPIGGTYAPGDTVTFCYTVDSFVQWSANWFHGIEVDLGPGWDMSTFTYVAPASCDGMGNWDWYPSVTSSATGLTVGPGFFYDSGSGGPLDGDPGNNFGDANGAGTCDWEFCWTVATDTSAFAPTDLTIVINHFGDGETGSWSSLSCTSDPPFIFSLSLAPCPLPDILVTNETCGGACDGSLTAVPSGFPPYSYLWSTGDTTPTISGLCSGIYTVTVFDNDTCSTPATAFVGIDSGFTISPVITNATCKNSTDGAIAVVPSVSSPAYTYNWAAPITATDSLVTGLGAGTYEVTVDNPGGCPVVGTYVVTEPDSVELSGSTNPPACTGGSNGSANVSATGGTGPYTYDWSTGDTGPSISGLAAGSYTVTATDANGCIDILTLSVFDPAPLELIAWAQNESCEGRGDGLGFTAVTGGVGPYNYLWMPSGQTTAIATGLTSGTYMVTVTDDSGCVDVDSITVSSPPAPEAIAGGDTSFCEGEGGVMIMGDATGLNPPFYYTWTCDPGPCGLSAVHDKTPIANPTTTTTYYLEITDSRGCVSELDSLVVTVLTKPVVDAGPDIHICADPAPGASLSGSVTGAAGPYDITWLPATGLIGGDTTFNPNARPLTTTIYTLYVTASNGCTSNSSTLDTNSTAIVYVEEQPIADAGNDTALCFGDSIMLHGTGYGAGPDYDYQWSGTPFITDDTDENPIVFPPLTTEIILNVFSNGCPSIGDTITVTVNTIPTVDAGNDVDRCPGDTAILGAIGSGVPGVTNYDFYWFPSTGLSDTAVQNPSASPDVTTTYYAVAVSPAGCESEPDDVLFTVNETPVPEAGDNQLLCPDDSGSVMLNGTFSWLNGIDPGVPGGVLYEWTPAGGLSDPNIPNPIAQPTVSTFYTLTTTYLLCGMSDSVLVQIGPSIDAQLQADTSALCSGDTALLFGSGGSGGASFTWTPSAGLNDPNIANPIATPDTTTTYLLTVSEGPCDDTVSITIDVTPTPTMSFLSSQTNGCLPLDVNFLDNSHDAINYVWDFGDGSPLSNETNPTHTYDSAGVYFVDLEGIGMRDCRAFANRIKIEVYDTASGTFSSTPIFPVEMVMPNTEVDFIPQVNNGFSYLWDFGDGTVSTDEFPTYTYTTEGTYMVTLYVTTEEGCVHEIQNGPYMVKIPELFIPNVFTPNGDGINDEFKVTYNGSQTFNIDVKDRWGKSVFLSKDKIDGWNGQVQNVGNEAQPGVYYYHINIGERTYTGNVTLMR